MTYDILLTKIGKDHQNVCSITLPEVPEDMDSTGDFINDSTAPMLPNEEEPEPELTDPFDALLSSAEVRALTT